jgi:hypothetical protein
MNTPLLYVISKHMNTPLLHVISKLTKPGSREEKDDAFTLEPTESRKGLL